MQKVGAVWMKEKDGKEFLSGKISLDADIVLRDGLSLLLFRPREARERSPNYEVFISKPLPKNESSTTSSDDPDIPF